MDFPDFSQFIIFGPKPYSRGSGARKQPQQRLSNVGLLPIGWSSAVLDRLAASQMRRIPGQATPPHTWGGSPPPLIRTFATCAMGWMGSGAGTSVKSLLPPCTDHGKPCQEACFSMIGAFPTSFLHFPQGIHRFAREIREFHIFS